MFRKTSDPTDTSAPDLKEEEENRIVLVDTEKLRARALFHELGFTDTPSP